MQPAKKQLSLCISTVSSGPEVIKLFFMLISAEHEIFSAHRYENANNSLHFHIYEQRNFHAQLCLARKNLLFLIMGDFLKDKFHAQLS